MDIPVVYSKWEYKGDKVFLVEKVEETGEKEGWIHHWVKNPNGKSFYRIDPSEAKKKWIKEKYKGCYVLPSGFGVSNTKNTEK